jgi:hypothetical protein
MKTTMKYNTILLLFFAIALLSACKKKEIENPTTNSSPIFTAAGTVGNENFLLEAGNENVFMSTFINMSNGVKVYSGKLGNEDMEIEIGFHEGNIDLDGPFNVQTFPMNLKFAALSSQPLAILSKDLLPNSMFIEEVKWYINGVFTGVNDVEIIEPGKYNVCAEVEFNDGSEATLCNEMILGFAVNASCKMRHVLQSNGNLKVWLDAYSTPVDHVLWHVDDTLIGESMNLNTNIDHQNHLISAEIYYMNGAHRKKSILVDGSLSGKLIDDFSVFENGSVSQIKWDHSVVLKVKKNGLVYSSVGADNTASSIQLLNLSYYGKNSAGKDVYKCIASVSANVREVQAGSILPIEFTTTFGLEMH